MCGGFAEITYSAELFHRDCICCHVVTFRDETHIRLRV